MNIIFQSGEFYGTGTDWFNILTTILSSAIGAIASGLIAIWIFKRGIAEQKNADREKELKRLQEVKKFYFHTIHSKLEPLKSQINYNFLLATKLREERASNFTVKFDPSLNFEELLGIDQKDIFNIFIYDEKSDTAKYIEMKNSIRLIETINRETKDILKHLDSKYQTYQDKFADKVDKIQKLVQRYTHSNDIEKIELKADLFLFDIWKQILEWEKLKDLDNRDPYILNENFLQPIRNICAKHHLDKRKPEILDLILDSQHYWEQLDTIKRLFREWIIKDTRQLIKAKIKIELALN